METTALNIQEIKDLIESNQVSYNDFRVENDIVYVSFISKDDEIDAQLEDVEFEAEFTDVVDYLEKETGNEVDFKDHRFYENLSWETETYYGVVDMTDWIEIDKQTIYEAVTNLSKI